MPCWMWALVGYVIRVERSEGRVFDDDEFEVVGATLVPEGSWADAPTDHVIVGLTELPNMDCTSSLPSLALLITPHSLIEFSSSSSCAHPVRTLLQRARKLGSLPFSLRAGRWGTLRHRISDRLVRPTCIGIWILRWFCWCRDRSTCLVLSAQIPHTTSYHRHQ